MKNYCTARLLAVNCHIDLTVNCFQEKFNDRIKLTGMGALVNLEILAAGENFAAAGERAGEGFLPSVHSNMIDQFVFGLEGAPVSRTGLPETGMRGAFRSPDVFHSEMRHDFVH